MMAEQFRLTDVRSDALDTEAWRSEAWVVTGPCLCGLHLRLR